MSNFTVEDIEMSSLGRGERVHIDPQVLEEVENSFLYNQPKRIGTWDTEAEAKGVLTKLRTQINKQDRGLRAKVVGSDEDGWKIDLLVSKKQVRTTS